tara:strand:- start:362 stop:1831 length:1470 start_codon:yes stop_codon:yes gene_type:complete
MSKKIIVIGSGFSSLSAATYLSKYGYQVTILEKNQDFGGRARQLKSNGFIFDLGPSFYWMPDVFEKYFGDFGKKVKDYYQLIRLDPAYKIFFEKNKTVSIPGSFEKILSTFENIEKGSSSKLKKFMNEAEINYSIAMNGIVFKPGFSIFELITFQTVRRVKYFMTTIKSEVSKFFNNKKLKQILEFPVLFLGAKPENTPAFYNIMNYADFKLGTWYPKDGMYSVVKGMVRLAEENGVKLKSNQSVEAIIEENNKIKGVISNGKNIYCDIVVSGADYHHTESLLNSHQRNYSESYWDKKVFAPSALLFYIGLNKKVRNLEHHNLFFDVNFDEHASAIYNNKKWPDAPQFYVTVSSITDLKSAPENCDSFVILIPIAPGLEDNEAIRESYLEKVLTRIEEHSENKIKDSIIYKKSYCINDFKSDYNSYKGNAYGLANTLFQTAIFKPKLRSKKIKGLYFTGQLTVPGPGVPPALISGKIVAKTVMQDFPNQ